jgi:excisionase family DNA binding protein
METSPRTLTVEEAAKLTGLTKTALKRRIDRGTLPAVVRGGRRRIPVSELYRRGLATPSPPADDSSGAATPSTPVSVPPGSKDGTGPSAASSGAAGWAELLNRLERQAIELAALQGLPAQIEVEQRSREQIEAVLHETRAELSAARTRIAELEASTAASASTPPALARRWWAPWRRPSEASPASS